MNIESFSTVALSGNMAASGNAAASANTSYSFNINMPSKDTSLCNFKPCFVIPVYNHGAALASVVQNLCYCGIPMILVDDGNDSKNRELILSASKLSPLCILLPLKKNSGKGKAFLQA
ncbi:MAG: glycosyltransferase [Treponema sp.]|nr:glycosyltransferase [Treponema sp.]